MRDHFRSFGKHPTTNANTLSHPTTAGPPTINTLDVNQDRNGESVSPIDQANVLSRLHALFGTTHPAEETNEGLTRAATEPAYPHDDDMISPGTVVDREAIKVLVVTWNMGDALPKGDLSVLFGNIPPYTPSSPTDGLPSLGVENKHPYHLVVVAGQECPTHSGVPRGLGGGLMKGVHVLPGHRKDREDNKSKDKDEDGEDEKDKDKDKEPTGLKSPLLGDTDEDSGLSGNVPSPSPTPTPGSSTPVLHKHNHPPGSKGWSTMLDDWFCGLPVQREREQPGSPYFINAGRDSSQTNPTPSPVPFLSTMIPPNITRSSSAPGLATSPTSTDPMHIPIPANLAGPFRHSPLARSASSSPSDSSASSPDTENPPMLGMPSPRDFASRPRPKAASTSTNPLDRPDIVIPNEEPSRTRDREGCYLHLVKERLMGMYLSVYVYRGCEHLVQGVDKDFVTAGLAGGRVGNKGGIGISVKLADHRFLFVNSHLAAHTARVGARIANIEKIKSELRLDCFLPKDDPRSTSEDLADRFDSVFWCGDLNFRLDMSRLHAEWLVEHKKYSEALMWDQLKAVMRDPQRNPFPGFEEHTIDFPPTFKYDVWRSIKSTNRELRRSLRRRGTLEGKVARRPSQSELSPRLAPQSNLSHVPEAEAHEELGVSDGADGAAKDSDEDTRTLASRRSFESNGDGYTSAGPSTVGTDADDAEEYSTTVDSTAYGSRHKAIEVALKEKTKHFLSLVKMDRVLTPSPSKRRAVRSRSVSRKVKEKKSMEFDASSRRTSVSSIASGDRRILNSGQSVQTSEKEMAARLSMSSSRSNGTTAVDQPLGPPRRPSDASGWIATSPNQQIGRRFSVLKRSVSGRSVKDDSRSGDSHDQGYGAENIDESVDYREGVYDSSKKQRVPSWCDRVLWKAHIVPEETNLVADGLPIDRHHSRLSNRFSTAFANFGGHLRMTMTRTGSLEPANTDRINNLNRPLPPTPPDSERPSVVASPEASPSLQPTLVDKVDRSNGDVPSPKRPSPRPSPQHSKLLINTIHTMNRTRSGSTHHPLLDTDAVQASPPAHPKITFDSALPSNHDRSPLSPTTINGRPRANSDGMGSATAATSADRPPTKRTISSGSAEYFPPRRNSLIANGSEARKTSEGSLKLRIRTSVSTRAIADPVDPSEPSVSLHRPHNRTHLSAGDRPISLLPLNLPEDRSSFVKFFKDIPHWLHVKSSSSPHDVVVPPAAELDESRPRRHLQGEVVCLHYGTIDDAGMRRLEGRSDHRPAIFAAAVYV